MIFPDAPGTPAPKHPPIVDIATSQLFGKAMNEALVHATVLLCGGGPIQEVQEALLEVCLRETTDIDVVARIVRASICSSPSHAHTTLSKWWDFQCEHVTHPEAGKDYFVAGLTIGLFESAVWFDEHWKREEEFLKNFVRWVECRILFPSDTPLGDWKGRLSNAIRTWFQPSGEKKGGRTAHALSIVGGLGLRGKTVSPLGEFIVEQITFAFFNGLPALSKARAMSLFWGDLKSELKI